MASAPGGQFLVTADEKGVHFWDTTNLTKPPRVVDSNLVSVQSLALSVDH
jgi:hypothetical protein